MFELPDAAPAEPVDAPKNAPVKPSCGPLIVYVLMFIGFLVGVSALAGVIMAHVNSGPSDDKVTTSHYAYQIRTFWWGLLWVILGSLLTLVFVGYFMLIAWFVWTLFRLIKGVCAWNKYQVIE